MRILRLDVKGFRSLRDIMWEPGPLNVVIGPNGTGKSNLLRLLELISVSARGRLGKHVQSWGGMESLTWDGSAESISFSVKCSPVDDTRKSERDALTYSVEMARLGKSSSFRIGNEILGNYYNVDLGKRTEPFKFLERQGLRAVVFDEDQQSLEAPEESVIEEETLLSLAAGPFTKNHFIPPFQSQLAAWSLYHDFHVDRNAAVRQPAVARLEKRVDSDGQNLIPVLHTLYTGDREFKKEVDAAMRAAFGDDYDELVFPPAADQKIQLRVRWKSLRREQSTADLSDGMLRFLFLLTVLASPQAAPVLAVDEPETGLHPSMLPIVAEFAVDAARRVQVILTTHSPQFLDAFGDTKPQTTVSKWVDGKTVLTAPDPEELERWLKSYSLGKLYASGELEDMA